MKILKTVLLVCIALFMIQCSRGPEPELESPSPSSEDTLESSLVSSEDMLKQTILDILDSEHTKNGFWGVKIKRLNDLEPLVSINEDKSFMPASNMKLYSTASFLTLLGKDFQYETLIYHNGNLDENGVLNGDVVIRGSGDPAISGRYRNSILTEMILQQWAEAFKEKGIKSIRGNIIGDDDEFADREISGTWQSGNLSYWYTAPSSALSINDNLYQLYMHPGKNPGEKAEIEYQLGSSYIEIQNDVITTEPGGRTDISYKRDMEGNKVRVWGEIPKDGSRDRVRGCVYNATLFSAYLVKEALEKAGITVQGSAKDIDEFNEEEKIRLRTDPKTIHVHTSPPVAEILGIINKPSQNFYADMLLKTLGKRLKEEGSFDAGEEAVKDFLQLAGAEGIDEFQMIDGSGLSRRNLVQPRQTIALLEYMARSPDFRIFYDSLAIAGVEGTIRRRMASPPTKGNVHAKTGFISHARSLSGYVDDLNGDRWVFSMMCNHWIGSTSNIDGLIDKVCIALANFGK